MWEPSRGLQGVRREERSQRPLGGTDANWEDKERALIKRTAGRTVGVWFARHFRGRLWKSQRIGVCNSQCNSQWADLGRGPYRPDPVCGPWDISSHWFHQELLPFSWTCSGCSWESLLGTQASVTQMVTFWWHSALRTTLITLSGDWSQSHQAWGQWPALLI